MGHPNSHPPVNILIVDDIQENVLAYKALLAPLGHTLVGVNSGEDALREVLDKDFAVIIMDARMPGLDGYETAALIKQRPSSQHVPIIFVTAGDDEPGRGYSVGAVDYMHKPVNVNVLQAKVNAFVELHNVKKGLEEANKLLGESEARYRTLFSASRAIMLIIEPKTLRIADANDAACRFYGYSKEGMLSKTMYEINALSPPDLNAMAGELINGKRNYFVLRHRLSTGEMRDVESHPTPITIGGKPMFFSIIHDITERKKAEAVLARLSAIVTSSTDAIISKDLDGRVTSWNRAAERMFGYTENEMIGQPMTLLIPPERAGEEPEILARIHRGESVDHFETARRRKNGEVFPVSVTISPVHNGTGAIIGASKIARDISERKAAEEKLKAAKEAAENATELKDKFLSLVSHDLKGPLGAVRGFLRIVQDDLKQSEKMESVKFADVAAKSVDRMLAMVNDLLNVGRLKSGIIIPRLALLNARELAGGELQGLAPSAAAKDVQLVNGMPEGMELCADRSLLAEVIQNLVSNAVKFSRKGGTVRVFSPGPGMIGVADDGVGIPPGRRAALFRYEESISTRGTAGEAGTGFGLPLSYDLVKAHGGELTFESEEGKGSAFSIRLPIHTCPAGVCKGTKETCPRFVTGRGHDKVQRFPAEEG